MLFPTIRFALFFLVAWSALLLVRDRPTARRLALVAASWFFYAAWNWRFLALLWWMIGLNHVAARLVAGARDPRRARWWLGAGVTANLALLAYFKYYSFFVESLLGLADRLGLSMHAPLVQVVLPLGISFLTFQAISYLVEVHRGVVTPAPLLDETVWLSFFPTIVSGPITRASELVPQLRRTPVCDDPNGALALVLRGMFKKVVIASSLATAVDDVFAAPARYSSAALLFAVYAYGAQIYADFSGYTDMARGLARLLGFQLPENFDSPYRAASIQEFWRRWHITLTRWLRDFLFTPLGLRWGRRRALSLAIPVVVMLLAGLWHGAAWTFVAFGGVHGLALASERWRRERRRRLGLGAAPDTRGHRLARHVVTLHIVALGWLFFRAESLAAAGTILTRIVTVAGGVTAISPLAVATVVAVVAAQFLPTDWYARSWRAVRSLGPVAEIASAATALTVIDLLGPAGVAPFIYFQF